MNLPTPDLEFGYIRYCCLQLLHHKLGFETILLHKILYYKYILERI